MSRRPDLTGRPARRRKKQLLAERPPWCLVCRQWIDTTLPGTHDDGPTAEHIIPVSKGGHPTDLSNQALSHRRCNTKRGNRSLASVQPKKIDRTSESWT